MKFKPLKQAVYRLWIHKLKNEDLGSYKLQHYVNNHKLNYLTFERYRKILNASENYVFYAVENETRNELISKYHSEVSTQVYWRKDK